MEQPRPHRSRFWVALAVAGILFGVIHAVCSVAAVINGPDLITVSSLLFCVFWYWIVVGAWRRSGEGLAADANAPVV